MSYIQRAQQNAEVAAKAAAFDKQQQELREQGMYAKGANDISSEVERQIRMRNMYSPSSPSAYTINPTSQQGLATTLTGY